MLKINKIEKMSKLNAMFFQITQMVNLSKINKNLKMFSINKLFEMNHIEIDQTCNILQHHKIFSTVGQHVVVTFRLICVTEMLISLLTVYILTRKVN